MIEPVQLEAHVRFISFHRACSCHNNTANLNILNILKPFKNHRWLTQTHVSFRTLKANERTHATPKITRCKTDVRQEIMALVRVFLANAMAFARNTL